MTKTVKENRDKVIRLTGMTEEAYHTIMLDRGLNLIRANSKSENKVDKYINSEEFWFWFRFHYVILVDHNFIQKYHNSLLNQQGLRSIYESRKTLGISRLPYLYKLRAFFKNRLFWLDIVDKALRTEKVYVRIEYDYNSKKFRFIPYQKKDLVQQS